MGLDLGKNLELHIGHWAALKDLWDTFPEFRFFYTVGEMRMPRLESVARSSMIRRKMRAFLASPRIRRKMMGFKPARGVAKLKPLPKFYRRGLGFSEKVKKTYPAMTEVESFAVATAIKLLSFKGRYYWT